MLSTVKGDYRLMSMNYKNKKFLANVVQVFQNGKKINSKQHTVATRFYAVK